jgi:hypothetical protein
MNDPLYLPFEAVFLLLVKLCHFIKFYEEEEEEAELGRSVDCVKWI